MDLWVWLLLTLAGIVCAPLLFILGLMFVEFRRYPG